MVRPAIVIVPGAWQRPHAYHTLQSMLQAAGFETLVVSLVSVGSTSDPLPGLVEDVAHVRETLEALLAKEHEVVVYCHSYGGVVGSNAVKGLDTKSRASAGLQGGVKALVYASAFMLPENTSLMDALDGKPLPWVDIQGDRIVSNANMTPQVGFNDLSKEDGEYWNSQMTWTSLSDFTTPSSYMPWTEGIASYYLFATEDNAIPLPLQEKMAAQLPAGSLVESEPTGHCAHLSRPATVTRILNRWFGA